MLRPKSAYLIIVFVLPLALGIALLGYWYWTVRVEQQPLLPNYGTVPNFTLLNESNQPFSGADMRGHISIADFIFTSCAGACPVMTMKMNQLQDTFSAVGSLHLVSFSVDPETDTPPVLASYASTHHAIPGKWTFVTGQKQSITTLTKEGFHLGLEAEGDDAIMHSEKFVLVDDEGAIRGYYDSDSDSSMNQLVADARRLLRRLPQ